MAYWHDFNPWADRLRYITKADAELLLANRNSYLETTCLHYGSKLDFYLLKNSGEQYSLGIRYGTEPWEYLSPLCNDELAAQIWVRTKKQVVA